MLEATDEKGTIKGDKVSFIISWSCAKEEIRRDL
jgi:hypothetical protein